MRLHRRIAARVSLDSLKNANVGWWEKRRRRWGLSTRNNESSDNVEPVAKQRLTPAILVACKAINEEATGFLYSRPFVFGDTHALHAFLTQIGPKHRPILRDIEVAEWGYSTAQKAVNFPAMSLLSDALNLERVMLNICDREVGPLQIYAWNDTS